MILSQIDYNNLRKPIWYPFYYQFIDGWCDLIIQALYSHVIDRFPDNSTFVEVGTWMGASTCCMAEMIKVRGKKINFYTIDTFEGTEGEPEHIQLIDKLKNKNLFETFQENLRNAQVLDLVTPLIGKSFELADKFKDKSLDFVFLDGDHHYEGVIKDLNAFWPKLKSGGLIAGHDNRWPGVYRAIKEFFPYTRQDIIDWYPPHEMDPYPSEIKNYTIWHCFKK